ncbi:hypothetical protein NNL21_10875 [Paenibacillus mendelii]|nr:hypothetical protein [Paenibacillus mendelii]
MNHKARYMCAYDTLSKMAPTWNRTILTNRFKSCNGNFGSYTSTSERDALL